MYVRLLQLVVSCIGLKDLSMCAGSGDSGLSDFVDALPTDLAMKVMVDAERVLTKKHHCQVWLYQLAKLKFCLHCVPK
jgi:hypothetical protein